MPGVKGHGLCVICNVTNMFYYAKPLNTVLMFHISYMHMFMIYIYGHLQKEIGKVFVNVAQTDLQWLKINKKIKVLRYSTF